MLSTVEEAIAVLHDLTEMLARRGFGPIKWITNNKQVLDAIPTTEQASKAHLYLLESVESDRVLGVHWQVTEDQFTFDVRLPNKPLTRRGILSMVASLHDPLGLASPVLLNVKRLLQSLCKEKTGWDQVIDELKTKLWLAWLEKLPGLNNIRIPRCFKPPAFGNISLYKFIVLPTPPLMHMGPAHFLDW